MNDIEKCKYELQKLGFKKQPVGEEDHGQVFGLKFKFNDLLQIHWKVMPDGLIESEMEPSHEIPGAHVNQIHSFSPHNTIEPILRSLKLPYETISSVPENVIRKIEKNTPYFFKKVKKIYNKYFYYN